MRRLLAASVALALTLAASPALAAGRADLDAETSAALKEVRRATAGFHDVGAAEAAGYGSTLDLLGCFENALEGGMGLHYLNASLLDGTAEADQPEALVYEMRPNGELRLVGLEYLVPAELVDPASPPELFGHQFHPHPVLPFWILHAWIWRDNPSGTFQDWNPGVRMCPEGVPVFGQ